MKTWIHRLIVIVAGVGKFDTNDNLLKKSTRRKCLIGDKTEQINEPNDANNQLVHKPVQNKFYLLQKWIRCYGRFGAVVDLVQMPI